MEIEVREPSRVVKRITDKRIDRAARELNLLNVSSKGLKNIATIGQFLNEIGLLQYGNGRLLGSAQMIAEGALACKEQALKDGIADEVRQAYLDLQLRFAKALDENVALQLEVNKVAAEKAANPSMPPGKPFLPGSQISPIQINGGTVQINAPGAQAKVEEPCKTSPT